MGNGPNKTGRQELTLPGFARLMAKNLHLLLLSAALAAVLALVIWMLLPVSYSSSATFYVYAALPEEPGPASSSQLTAAKELAKTCAQLLQSQPVLEAVAAQSGGSWTAGQLESCLWAQADGALLTLQVRADSARQAQELAQIFAQVVPPLLVELTNMGQIRLLNQPQLPARPDGPGGGAVAVFGGICGLLLCVAVLVLHRIYTTVIRSRADALLCLEEPVLAVLPNHSPGTLWNLTGKLRTACESLRTELLYALPVRADGRVILVTGADARAEKSETAAALAASFALLGKKTLLVDCDLRSPFRQKWKLPAGPGLRELLESGQRHTVSPEQHLPLEILVAGDRPVDPAELLQDERVTGVLSQLRQEYSFIILQAPALETGCDGMILAPYADGVVLTLRSGLTRRQQVLAARQQLQRSGACLCGAVLEDYPAVRRLPAFLEKLLNEQ